GDDAAAYTRDTIETARVPLTTTATVATLGAPVGLTDADGRFAIAGAADAQRVVASKSGYARSEPAAATGQPIEIRLRRGATISGRVVDQFGDPVAGARVAAQASSRAQDNPASVAVAESDDRGEYRLAG